MATSAAGASSPDPLAPAHSHRGDVDGLRAVAVTAVVAFHADVPGLVAGFVGVDVFFVVSGFLIMSLLLREVDGSGRVDLLQFWGRRVRRLAPALLVVVIATILASFVLVSPLRWRAVAVDGLWSSLYVSNVTFAMGTKGYFAAGDAPSPFLHTWSLAVEEQFYVVWPLAMAVVAVVARRVRRSVDTVAVAVVAVGVAVSIALSVFLSFRGSRWAYFSLPTRWWEIGIGISTALLLRRWRPSGAVASVLALLGVAALLVSIGVMTERTPYPGVAALLPTIGTALLIAAGPSTPVARLLAVEPLQRIGQLSYAWYLWHWPVIVLASSYLRSDRPAVKVMAGLAALPLALLTHRLVENPVRFRPALVGSPGRSIVVGVVGVVVVGALAFWAGVAQDRRLEDPFLARLQQVVGERQADVTGCFVAGVPSDDGCGSGRRVVMLIGDSHAAHWAPGLVVNAAEFGVDLYVRTRGGCPAWGYEVAATGSDEPSEACGAYLEETWADIDRIAPVAVVIAGADYTGRVLDGSGRVVTGRDEAAVMRRAVEARLQSLQADVGAVGVILDNPYVPFDPVECLVAEGDGDGCRFDRADGIVGPGVAREVQASIAEELGVEVFDGSSLMCEGERCDTEIGGQVVYGDRTHLARSFVVAEAGALQPMFDRLAASG